MFDKIEKCQIKMTVFQKSACVINLFFAVTEMVSVRQNAFLVIQRCSLLLASYKLIAFFSDNKVNLFSLTGFNSFLSKLEVYLFVVFYRS